MEFESKPNECQHVETDCASYRFGAGRLYPSFTYFLQFGSAEFTRKSSSLTVLRVATCGSLCIASAVY